MRKKLLIPVILLVLSACSEDVALPGDSRVVPSTTVSEPSGTGERPGHVNGAKDRFDLELTSIGENKISVIKVVREITLLGLADAKNLVESAPVVIASDLSKDAAEGFVTRLTEVGAEVRLK